MLRLPNWLGDLVQSLPVVEAVVAKFGAGTLLVGPGPFASLLTPRVPAARYHPWTRTARYALARALRRERPAAALLLTESFSSALLALLSGAPQRIGFEAEGRGFLLTRRVRRPEPVRSTPRAREYRLLAEAAGIRVREESPRLDALATERTLADAVLREAGLEGGRYAVLAPGAIYGPTKRWASERFAALARHWTEVHGLTVLLVGSREDREAADGVAEARGGSLRDLTGRTDLPALAGLLSGAAVVASNDSGVMHLAAALGRPTVAVFGSTSPVWTSAGAPWVRSLYAAYPCSPCFRRTCPIGYGCLKAISAAEAIRAADEVMRRAEEARPGAATVG
ncbi:MAG TPA: lipopolysaccharide heptosyltransferase II [Candidatus Eisenbacteria bacterium]